MNNENTFSDIINKLDKEFVDSFKTNNKINTDCEKCIHKIVCKEIDNWSKYCEEHIRLREKSILFDEEPKCPYYIEIEKNGVFDNMKSPKEPKYGIRNAEFKDGYKSVPCNELTDSINKESAVEHTKHYKFDNGSEIKTIPYDGNTRGKRAELPILYFDYEKCENKEELFEILMKALFK